jgi:hypothetical protein
LFTDVMDVMDVVDAVDVVDRKARLRIPNLAS